MEVTKPQAVIRPTTLVLENEAKITLALQNRKR